MSKPKFIVFEGLDLSGKTTQASLLYQAFETHNIPCHLTRECSDGPIGNLLRDLFLSGDYECDERVINQLYVADRFDHITNPNTGMLSYLHDGVNVICDRYVMSSLAYDTYEYIDSPDYNKYLRETLERNHRNMDLLMPDLTIFLSVPADIAIGRLKDRNEKASVYEQVDKMQRISMAYSHAIDILRDEYGMKINIIDGMKPIDVIHFHIWDWVKDLLEG